MKLKRLKEITFMVYMLGFQKTIERCFAETYRNDFADAIKQVDQV